MGLLEQMITEHAVSMIIFFAGRQYDADGNFELWWSNETLAKFKKGAACFIDQYSQIKDPVTNMTLNGENTQGENIADNGGLKLAYKVTIDMWVRVLVPTMLLE